MTNPVSLKYNILYNILYQILVFIVPLITAPYISRIIGKEGMGIYGYTYSIAHYFMLLTMLGITNYGAREIAATRNNKEECGRTFCSIYPIQLAMGILSLLLYIGYLFLFSGHLFIVSLSWCFYLISGAMDISWFFFGIERFKITTIVSSINKIITTIMIFLLVKEPDDINLYVLIISIGGFLNNVVYWYLIRKKIGFSFPTVAIVKNHIKPLLVLFLPVIAINIYRYISKIMLGVFFTMSDVGIYEAAEKLINLPLCFIAAIGTVMLSRISSMNTNDMKSDINRYNHISMVLVLFLSIGMTFGLLGISDVFVPFFYGSLFSDASIVLKVLLPSIVVVSWANVIRTQYLLPNRKDSVYCISVMVGAIVNIIANLILLPIYGVIGAAVSSVLAEVSVCFFQSWYYRKNMKWLIYLKESIPFFLFGGVMFFVIITINANNSILTILSRLVVGALIYLFCSYIYVVKSSIFRKLTKI